MGKRELEKELKKLLKARLRSKDKGFVMDTYSYEDELREQIKELK